MSCLEPQTPASMSYTGSFSASPSPTLSTTELRYDSPATYPPATRCSRCAKRSAPGYESSLMKECKRCFLVRYCSPKCQRAHRELHMAVCTPSKGITYVAAWGVSFQDTNFESYRDLRLTPCLSTPQMEEGWVCDATQLIGLPIYLVATNDGEHVQSKDLTTVCHYLMMDPDTGFAMDKWICDRRHTTKNYVAFHKDAHPLTEKSFETVVAFLKMIVETVSGLSPASGWSPMRSFLTPQAFQLFSRLYWAEQARNEDREGWDELTCPLL